MVAQFYKLRDTRTFLINTVISQREMFLVEQKKKTLPVQKLLQKVKQNDKLNEVLIEAGALPQWQSFLIASFQIVLLLKN